MSKSDWKRDKSRIRLLEEMRSKGYEIDKLGRIVHRHVYEEARGKIPHKWVVHHVDEDKKNNKIDNLVAMPRQLYDRIHSIMRRDKIRFNAAQLEAMVKSYTSLDKNRDLAIKLEVTISWTQIQEALPAVKAQLVEKTSIKRSGSSNYR